MSGDSQQDQPNVLNNQVTTEKSVKLRVMLGLNADKSFASHVEPQLIAYLFYKDSVWTKSGKWKRIADQYNFRPVIIVGKPAMCGRCIQFISRFEEEFPRFGVQFHFDG